MDVYSLVSKMKIRLRLRGGVPGWWISRLTVWSGFDYAG